VSDPTPAAHPRLALARRTKAAMNAEKALHDVI
jgi:hypothetical protein